MAAARVLASAARLSQSVGGCRYALGLTGGIASGKSHARRVLGALGAFAVDVDKIAWSVYEVGTPAYKDIVASSTFGREVLAEDGSIDRAKLGAKVFVGDSGPMKELNGIVWPRIPLLVRDHLKLAIDRDDHRDVIVLTEEWQEWAEEAADVPAEFARLCAAIDDSIEVATSTKEKEQEKLAEEAAESSSSEDETEGGSPKVKSPLDLGPVAQQLRAEAKALSAKRRFLAGEVEAMNDPESSSNFSFMSTPSAPDAPMLELVELPGAVAVVEAAVMVEAGWHQAMEEVWLCEVDEGEAIRRVVERDGVDEEAARSRLQKQANAAERQGAASVVIDTTGSQRVTRWMLLREWTALVRRLQRQDGARELGGEGSTSSPEEEDQEDGARELGGEGSTSSQEDEGVGGRGQQE